MIELKDSEFQLFRKLIYEKAGITLPPEKSGLVRCRLMKRLNALNLDSFDEYYDLVNQKCDGGEITNMLDAITTNKTGFFREAEHFKYARNVMSSQWKNLPEIRILSAGCSTGEEPYTLGMVSWDAFGSKAPGTVKIQAGDLSNRALNQARRGVYSMDKVRDVPLDKLHAHFLCGTDAMAGSVKVAPHIQSMVDFKPLNLMEPLPYKSRFHAIFCRNVMIYFDMPTRMRILSGFQKLLRPGGLLFLGMSESMVSFNHQYKYIQPAVYQMSS